MSASTKQSWQVIAAERKKQQEDSIPQEWRIPAPADDVLDVTGTPDTCTNVLNDLEREITNTIDVEALLRKMASREWSSYAVTLAFYKRAIVAHQLTNCLTEIFIDKALERAKELDQHLEQTGQVYGPLHGLPISLKDQFNLKGIETIMGYVSWVGKVAEKDATIVEVLYQCGAVPFVRTNVPQTLMWGETFNNVFGRTTNPYNRKLTPGGSSGGEGALIALRGSPLGIGTDIGGSVRIPAGFCGLYTLRPSYNRFPYQGASNSLEGQEAIQSVLGPMASNISALKIFTKAILDAKPWNKDPSVVRKPWSQAEYELVEHGGKDGKLCFAVMVDNGVVRPQPPVKRVMAVVVDALREAGHTVIEWENKLIMELLTVTEHIYSSDGGQDYRAQCAPTEEPLIQTMMPHPEEAERDLHHPWDPHPHYLDEPLTITLRKSAKPLDVHELWALHKRKREIQKLHLDHWMNTKLRTGTGRPIDALLSPVAPFPAPPHGLNSNDFYTNMFNFLDYACTTIPVTTVDPALDKPEEPPREFYNQEDEAVFKLYRPDSFWNSPIGVQIVGQVQEEEAVIGLTEIVDRAVKAWKQRHSAVEVRL